jgi:hypothetical protein
VIVFTKSSIYDEKMLVDNDNYHKLNTALTVLIILISCLGVFTAIMISELYGLTIFIPPFSSKETVTSISDIDLGSVNGFETESDGSPVDGALGVVYKQMGLNDSTVQNIGYTSSVETDSDSSYVFAGLPTGIYKFEMTYPDNNIHASAKYAVWPSSTSSYDIKANILLTT